MLLPALRVVVRARVVRSAPGFPQEISALAPVKVFTGVVAGLDQNIVNPEGACAQTDRHLQQKGSGGCTGGTEGHVVTLPRPVCGRQLHGSWREGVAHGK